MGAKRTAACALSGTAAAVVAPAAATMKVQLDKGVVATAEEDEAVVTRAEEIESLPEFGDVIGLSMRSVPSGSGSDG